LPVFIHPQKLKRMKKLMLVLGLMSIVVFTHAAEQKESKTASKIEHVFAVQTDDFQSVLNETGNYFDCIMTASATISVGVVKIEVSCSASGADCDKALATAEGCVTSVIKRIKAAIM
jgi:hypothetical protein